MDASAQTFIVGSLTALGGAALWLRRPSLAGSTLTAVWWWQAVALASLAAAAIGSWRADDGGLFAGAGAARYTACTATVCPLMALLGAKRPQSRAWFAIVAALWMILAMPAFFAAAYNPRSGGVWLDPVRSSFLFVLILIGFFNWLPTRAAPAHVLQALGQIGMLAPFLPRDPLAPQGALVGLLGLALYAAGVIVWNPLGGSRRGASRPLNRAWLDFRDAYGLVWGVRVLDRFNYEGVRQGWKIRLGWLGLRSIVPGGGAELSPEVDLRMRRTLRSLLRPFLARAWLDQRAPLAA